jgi:hypothetical protein
MPRGNNEDTFIRESGLLKRSIKIEKVDEKTLKGLIQKGEDIKALGSPLEQKSHVFGEPLLVIHSLIKKIISADEVLLAQSSGFTSEKTADSLIWRKDGKMLGDKGDRNHYKTASGYRWQEEEDGRVFYKEWLSDGLLSRHPDEGPASIMILQKKNGQEIRRYQWHYRGRLLHEHTETYEKGDDSLLDFAPEKKMPLPSSDILANALTHCQNREEEALVSAIRDIASNPFAMERSDYVEEDDLYSELGLLGKNKEAVTQALQNLLDRGVIVEKRRSRFIPGGADKKSYCVSKTARETLAAALLVEDRSGEEIAPDILDNLRKAWLDMSEENIKRIIGEAKQQPKDFSA